MIRYAGVETLLPIPELEAYINAHLAPELAQYCCPAGGGAELDATSPFAPQDTWQKLFSPKLNCLYWPTGASRWSTMLLLVDSSMLDTIVPLTSDAFSTNFSAEPAQLVIADSEFTGTIADDDWSLSESGKLVAMSTAMFALRPHPISSYTSGGGKTLWVLPIVDERYFWQWKNVGVITETPETWAALIDHFEEILGVTITEGDIEDIYATVSSLANYPYANAAVMLDAILRKIGHRFSRRITGECRTYAPSAAATVFDANTTDPDGPTHKGVWRVLAGGEFTYNGAAAMPEKIRVIGEIDAGQVHLIDVGDVGGNQWRTGTEATIFTAYPDDYPPGMGAVDFATQVATDWVGWRSKRVDRSFVGVKSWSPAGFEDYFVICHGNLQNSPSTRVITRPENTGVEPWPATTQTTAGCITYFKLLAEGGPTDVTFDWQVDLISTGATVASGSYALGDSFATIKATIVTAIGATFPVIGLGPFPDNEVAWHINQPFGFDKYVMSISNIVVTPVTDGWAYVKMASCCIPGG